MSRTPESLGRGLKTVQKELLMRSLQAHLAQLLALGEAPDAALVHGHELVANAGLLRAYKLSARRSRLQKGGGVTQKTSLTQYML